MINDNDKWVPNVEMPDYSVMPRRARIFHVALGLAILFVIASPYLPPTVWTFLEPVIVSAFVGVGMATAVWFIVQGVRGRW